MAVAEWLLRMPCSIEACFINENNELDIKKKSSLAYLFGICNFAYPGEFCTGGVKFSPNIN